MGCPNKIVFVRHAQSEGNLRSVDERAQLEMSTYAYPLTALGIEQAKITGEYLRQQFPDGFDVYYSSYYTRAKQTLETMFPDYKSLIVREDARLAESQRGIYHALTKSQIESIYPTELQRKDREGLYHYRPLGGENWPDVELRARSFIDSLKEDYHGKNVLVVMHGFWMLMFQHIHEEFSIPEALDRYAGKGRGMFENASITTYDQWYDRLTLSEENFVPWKGKL